MTGAGASAWEWAVGTAWQAALLALLVAAADRVLSRRGLPHLRHALWLVVLVKLALPPALTSPWSVAAALRAPASAAGAASGPAAAGDGVAVLPAVALAVWTAGAAVVTGLAVLRSVRLRRALLARRLSVPDSLRRTLARAAATMGVRRAPRLVLSRAATGIVLVGAFRPLVVVPVRPLSLREAEHAFLHELAHHRRRDLLVALAATVVRCVFWWHPAAWLAAARLAALREQCCDADVAAALGEEAPAYRETLIEAARRMVAGPRRSRVAEIAWLGGGDCLVARLDALSRTPSRRTRLQRAATTATVIAAAACAVPMGATSAPPDEIELARGFLADAVTGRTRVSCFQTKYAALVLAAAQASQEGSHR